MQRLRTQFVLFGLAFLAAAFVPVRAQKVTQHAPAAPDKIKTYQPAARPMPFPIDQGVSGKMSRVEFLSVDQMSEKDRLQSANAESAIAEHAGHTNLEFNQGQWSYQQVVCPALPNHIFLRFLRNNGVGDVSVFTASIPRGGEGRVRIIPIQMRSYSLFSPAPINALTISAFNHIRAEDNPDRAPVADWLGTALCYAALAGGHPVPSLVSLDPPADKFPVANSASLTIPDKGGAILSFADISTAPKSMTWTMTFDGKGRLLKAAHTPATLLPINWYHPAPLDPKTVQLLGVEPKPQPAGTQ